MVEINFGSFSGMFGMPRTRLSGDVYLLRAPAEEKSSGMSCEATASLCPPFGLLLVSFSSRFHPRSLFNFLKVLLPGARTTRMPTYRYTRVLVLYGTAVSIVRRTCLVQNMFGGPEINTRRVSSSYTS